MSPALLARRLPTAKRIHALRERRVRAAEAELAAAQAEALRCEEGVRAAQARLAEVDNRRRELEDWFTHRLDPRHIDSALARRGALVAQREQAADMLDTAREELTAALGLRAAAAARLAKAQGRLDLAAQQVAACRRGREALAEADAEAEYEDRGRRTSSGGMTGAMA